MRVCNQPVNGKLAKNIVKIARDRSSGRWNKKKSAEIVIVCLQCVWLKMKMN